MGCYTVGIAGLTVNQVFYDSGGLTPSRPTIIAQSSKGRTADFDSVNIGSTPIWASKF